MNTDDVRRVIRNGIRDTMHNEGRRAVLGKTDGTIYFVDDNGIERRNRVWVRYLDGDTPTQAAVVRNGGVPQRKGTPLRVKTINNITTAFPDQLSELSNDFTNGTGYSLTPPHDHSIFSGNPIYVEDLRYLALGVTPSSPAALTVYVWPGFYRYNGVKDVWEGGDSGSLSSYVPGTDDGTVHFVIICLDRPNNSIVIVDGDDIAATGGGFFPDGIVTYTDVEAIAIDESYYPLAVVKLTYGQTTVTARDIVFDHRYWGGEVGNAGNIAALFLQTADKTIANTVTETDLFGTGEGSLTLPANLLEVGTTLKLTMAGHVSTTGTPNITVAVDLGGTELCSTGAQAIGPGLSNVGWRLEVDIACRTAGATGTVVASGLLRLGANNIGLVKTTPTTVDTTGTLALTAPETWGAADAANTITSQTATLQRLAVTGL